MQDEVLKIAVLAGTTREQRRSIHAARFVAKVGNDIPGVEIRFADPKDFYFPGDGEDPESKDPKYTELTAWADAFFVVSPEYNHSFPGSLKRMLDSELSNYKHKPVAIAGVSDGAWGGVRMIESLLHVVRTLGLVPLGVDVQFPKIKEAFNEDETPTDPEMVGRVRRAYDELIWMGRALKNARNQ